MSKPTDETGHYPRVWEVLPQKAKTRQQLLDSGFWDTGEGSFRMVLSRVMGYSPGGLDQVCYSEDAEPGNQAECWVHTSGRSSEIRRKLSELMGLDLAVWDVNCSEWYDPDHWETVKGFIWTRCAYGNRLCVRPSHIVLAWKGGRLVP